jgi:hypothetical protein
MGYFSNATDNSENINQGVVVDIEMNRNIKE